MRTRLVYYTALLLLILPAVANSQRPVKSIPRIIIDEVKPTPTVSNWVRSEHIDRNTGVSFTTYILTGDYLDYPFVHGSNHPALVLVCSKGYIYSASLRVHGSDPGKVKLLILADRKKVFTESVMYDAEINDPALGPDRILGVDYSLIPVDAVIQAVYRSSYLSFNAVGVMTSFNPPPRPVGLDTNCGLK